MKPDMVVEGNDDYLIVPAKMVRCNPPLGQVEGEPAFFLGVNDGFAALGLAGCVAVQDFKSLAVCECVGQAG